jgi:hypothetical protein
VSAATVAVVSTAAPEPFPPMPHAEWSATKDTLHHFWHTFDIAVTRFSGRVVDHPPHVDPVTREAYSREVISAGFWFGDPRFPEAAGWDVEALSCPGGRDGYACAGLIAHGPPTSTAECSAG